MTRHTSSVEYYALQSYQNFSSNFRKLLLSRFGVNIGHHYSSIPCNQSASQLNQDMSVVSACSTDNVRGPELTESVVISSTLEPEERLKYRKQESPHPGPVDTNLSSRVKLGVPVPVALSMRTMESYDRGLHNGLPGMVSPPKITSQPRMPRAPPPRPTPSIIPPPPPLLKIPSVNPSSLPSPSTGKNVQDESLRPFLLMYFSQDPLHCRCIRPPYRLNTATFHFSGGRPLSLSQS